MERLNRFLSFDEKQAILRAEAGVSMADLLRTLVPRGWFVPVTPGTKWTTLGGCVAADVHGKNHHHDGSFGAHVDELEVLLADGSSVRCSPTKNCDLFRATIGGMGLTGIILEVALRLKPIETAHMVVQHHISEDLDRIFQLFESKAWDDATSVAWIDCLAKGRNLGRGVLIRGHHASRAEIEGVVADPLRIDPRPRRRVPFDLPTWTLNRLSVAAFNRYYISRQARRAEPFLVDYDTYFYPLDSLDNWNRLYGKKGFVQYQCVLPMNRAHEGLQSLLEAIRQSRQPSFLAVLKRFGDAGSAYLSFPMAGYTLALDFPLANQDVLSFLHRLDEIVLRYEGRVYLAKDARLETEVFRNMYPKLHKWLQVKASADPNGRFSSDLSRRLGLEPDK
jgi:FAD/FMN-containing dehydrogenase